jgi:hypothetical protein
MPQSGKHDEKQYRQDRNHHVEHDEPTRFTLERKRKEPLSHKPSFQKGWSWWSKRLLGTTRPRPGMLIRCAGS